MAHFRILKTPDGKPIPVNVENIAWLDYTPLDHETAIYFISHTEPLIVLGSMAINIALLDDVDGEKLQRAVLELLAELEIEGDGAPRILGHVGP